MSSLANSVVSGKEDLRQLDKRNTPLQEEFAKQWLAADECDTARNTAATHLEKMEASYTEAVKTIEGLEGDVEALIRIICDSGADGTTANEPAFSFTAWIKPTNFTNRFGIINKRGSTIAEYNFFILGFFWHQKPFFCAKIMENSDF